MRCAACGAEVVAAAKFCSECGARLGTEATADEQRKTVTVLFSDVTGSTAMGERLDPETMRRILARFFETARARIEAHGGTVEKFIGDAVMAVFGVPVLHEDDALRAVRAAADLHAALPGLNEEFGSAHGIALELRTGVTTGEVVTGTAERLATGDAVNVAARLQQHARPGEILLGAPTVALVKDAVSVTERPRVALKGKADPVDAFLLESVDPATKAPRRRRHAPLIGRENDLLLLQEAFRRAVRQQTCNLFTVLGPAGIGKTRLVEAFASTADATVAGGRCPPYGPGVTYGPVAEVADALLAEYPDLLADEPLAALGVDVVVGRADDVASPADLAWAVRKLLERAAARRPLVVVLDDLHWAQSTVFDLVDHVVDLSRAAPILLVCVARPELLDHRPGWAGGKLHSTTILLDPLDDEEAGALVDAIGRDLEDDLRNRVLERAAGNPLFLEEMVGLVAGGAGGDVPPTIQALLAARLDQLDEEERRLLEVGSVEGRVFHRSALTALGDDDGALAQRLAALVRKELIREDEEEGGEGAFRFRHALLRDAAYERLAKSARAELHTRLARWIDGEGGRDEAVGWHLEQAAAYRASLGALDEEGKRLSAEAGRRLGTAGLRALEANDLARGVELLRRATALLRDPHLEIIESNVLSLLGRLDEAIAVAEAIIALGVATGERSIELTGRLTAALHRVQHTDADADELSDAISKLRPLAEGGDEGAAVWYWGAVASRLAIAGRYGDAAAAAERGREHAERLGWRFVALATRIGVLELTALGPAPVSEGIRLADAIEAEFAFLPVVASLSRVRLLALGGQIETAQAELAELRLAWKERGEATFWEDYFVYLVEAAAGNGAAAAAALRAACANLEALGRWSNLSTAAAQLACLLLEIDEDDEADALAQRGLALGRHDDVETQVAARSALAVAAARRGERDEAAALAEEALSRAKATQAPQLIGQALLSHGEVLALAGEAAAAAAAFDLALETYEEKGAVVLAEKVRRRKGVLLESIIAE